MVIGCCYWFNCSVSVSIVIGLIAIVSILEKDTQNINVVGARQRQRHRQSLVIFLLKVCTPTIHHYV